MQCHLHLSLTDCTHESRLLKETSTVISHQLANYVYIVGTWKKDLPEIELLDTKRTIFRVRLTTQWLPKTLPFQLIKYLEFGWIVLRKHHSDLISVHALALLPIGVLHKFLFNSKLIYNAHEYETQRQGLHGSRQWLSKIIEKTLIKYCDHTLVVSESIAHEYKLLYPLISPPTVILNTPLLHTTKKKNIFRETLNIQNNQKIFLYQGALSQGRGIETLLSTFQTLQDTSAVIVFMGNGHWAHKIQTISKHSSHIFYHPAVSPEVLHEYTSSADFGISLIENSCLSYYYCLPNKLFEYLMAGLPVIVSNLYEMAKIVNTHHIGIIAKENSPEGLTEAINQITQIDPLVLKVNIEQAQRIFNWEIEEKKLIEVYRAL